MKDLVTSAAVRQSWSEVRLIAGREIVMMLRSKAFRVLTALTLLAIVAAVVVVALLTATRSVPTVGVVAGDAAIAPQLQATASGLGDTINVRTVRDLAVGRGEVADGKLAAVLASDRGGLQVTVAKRLDPTLGATLSTLARQLALDEQVRGLGGDPATVNRAVATAKVSTVTLTPPKHYDIAGIVLGGSAGVLIYMSLMIQGQRVAQGVVEEKSSRVVELLISTVRPWQLMVGKVLGIGLVGLLQMLAFGIVGAGLASGVGLLHVATGVAVATVGWLLVWYLLGFVLYAFALAAAGAMVSRQDDAGTVVMPVLLPVIAGYVLAISILPSNPASRLCEVLSIIPIFSPTLMPARLAMGNVPVWETTVSILLTVIAIPLLAAVAARIYRNGILRTGQRLSLRQVLRSDRPSAPTPSDR